VDFTRATCLSEPLICTQLCICWQVTNLTEYSNRILYAFPRRHFSFYLNDYLAVSEKSLTVMSVQRVNIICRHVKFAN
jgi:hypothetical protein